MYSASLAQASAQGVIFPAFIVAVAMGIYFIASQKAEALGASALILFAAFLARDYYHLVYAAGFALAVAFLMTWTSFDEGTIRGAMLLTGVGLFASLILFYLMPATFSASMDTIFIIMIIIAAIFTLVPQMKGDFDEDWKAAAAFLGAIFFAFVFINVVGITHLIWGTMLMAFAILWLKLVGQGAISTVAFIAGFVIWLDDVVGYFLYHQNPLALSILGPIGLGLVIVYAFLMWEE